MGNQKKKIFIGERELEESLMELFMKLSMEYSSEGDGAEFEYHLYGENGSGKYLTFEKNANIAEFLESNGRGLICPEFITNPLANVLLDRFFEGVGSLDPSASIAEFLNESFTLKISNPMGLGYFQDLITENAVLQGFDFVSIRNYLSSILSFCSYLKFGELGELPFDVDYGYSEQTFYLQISLSVNNFLVDNLVESMKTGNGINPYNSAVKTAYENSHFLDIFSLEKGAKLCFCSIWQKALDDNTKFFPSLLVHQLYSRSEIMENNALAAKVNLQQKKINDDMVTYPGNGPINFVDEEGNSKNNNAILIKQIISFLEDKRVEAGEELITFTENHYRKHIEGYPVQDDLQRLNPADINLIIECLNSKKKKNKLNEEVQLIKDNLEDEDYAEKVLASLEEFEEEAQVISGAEEEDDHAETVSGGEEEDKYSEKISGATDKMGEDFQRVKGSKETNDKSKVVIKGAKESLKKDVWKVKGLKASAKIKEEVTRLKGSGATAAEINMKVKSLIQEDFGDDQKSAEMFFENISDGAADKIVSNQEIKQASIFDNVHVDLDIELPDDDDAVDSRQVQMMESAVKLRDQQLVKMKKLMDRMKKEVEKERRATSELTNIGGTGVSGEKMRDYISQATELKSTLVNMEKDLVTTKNILEQEKKNRDVMARNFEREKDLLLKRLEDYEGTVDDGPKESIAQIKSNNEALTRQVEELKKKISVILENNQKNHDEMVSSYEYNRVKTELSDSITKLSDALAEKKNAIDQSKSLAFKLRAAEQRIKSYSAKIEKIQSIGKTADAGSMDPKSAHRVKHLEKTNERLQALNKKTSDELSEKKAELHKAKMENKTLQSKVKELEKKMEKKAA